MNNKKKTVIDLQVKEKTPVSFRKALVDEIILRKFTQAQYKSTLRKTDFCVIGI
jgi:hypothetical protein